MTTRVDEAARLPDLGAALDKLPPEAREYFKQLDYQTHWIIRDFAQRHWALETTVGTVPRKPGTLLSTAYAPINADFLVKTANSALTAERVVTDTATVTWDWSTPGQAKANAVSSGGGGGDRWAEPTYCGAL